jgi:hypothetical protein
MTVYDERGVPVVYRGEGQSIGLSQPLEFDPSESLNGESVLIHCKALSVAPDEEGRYACGIGASNLDEALKDVIGGFDQQHLHPAGESSDALHTPDWVASTHDGLATALADYYSCEKRDIAEVLAA